MGILSGGAAKTSDKAARGMERRNLQGKVSPIPAPSLVFAAPPPRLHRAPTKPPATEAKQQAYSCTNLSITSHLIQLKLPPLCGNLREADKFSVTGAGRLLWEFVNKNCIWAFYKRNFVKTAMSRALRLVYVSSVG